MIVSTNVLLLHSFSVIFEMYLLPVLIYAKVACLCLYQVAKYPSNILKNCVSQVGKGSKH